MAAGQKFNLDLDADNWQFDLHEGKEYDDEIPAVKGILERNSDVAPAAPVLKSTKTGFPEHRPRKIASAFKQQRQKDSESIKNDLAQRGPSDRALLHQAAQKHGINLDSRQQSFSPGIDKDKADIDTENRNRINQMSVEEIEEARSELMAQFNPDTLRKFLQRADIGHGPEEQPVRDSRTDVKDSDAILKYLQRADLDEEQKQQQEQFEKHETRSSQKTTKVKFNLGAAPDVLDGSRASDEGQENLEADKTSGKTPSSLELQPALSPTTSDTIHFPNPPRRKEDYRPLDPSSNTFLEDLREHYFPDLPHDPNALSWLQDPSSEEEKESPYNPNRAGFAPSAIRFDFNGRLIPPSESISIPTSAGLHHHGDAPSSAGYTVPELTLLARSTLPSQRCVAYQVMGRILYRLGRGDYGPKGGELYEGLWYCIEKERVVEVMMTEANRQKGHVSARTFATEALWLWRRGGRGERGVLKEGQSRAK